MVTKRYSHLRAIIFLTLLSSTSVSQTWQWGRTGVGINGYAESFACAADANGNLAATGCFQSPTILFGNVTLTNAGLINVFTVKYNTNGTALWAASSTASGNFSNEGWGTCLDPSGNVISVGMFQSPSITFGSTTLPNAGGGNAFIVKYGPTGNFLWANRSVASQGCIFKSVAADAMGNIYALGWFTGPSVTFGTINITSTGSNNICLVKYDASGNVVWVRKSVGAGTHFGYGVSLDPSGNANITGGFSGSTIAFGSTTLTNTGADDVFVVKYDASGNVTWAKNMSGSGVEKGQSISVDANSNVYVVGYFASTPLTAGTNNVSSAGSNDAFIAKYDGSGNELWIRRAGGSGNDYGYSVAATSTGLFMTGCMGTYANNNGGASITVGTLTLNPPPGSFDPSFIAQYDNNGNLLWADALGGGGDDELWVASDQNCNAYIGGDNYGMDPFIFGNDSLHMSGVETFFCAKLTYNMSVVVSGATSICAGQTTTLTATGALSYTWSNTTFTDNIVVSPTITTTYSVVGAGAGSCPPTPTFFTVNVKPSPALTAINSKTVICKGESATLTASGANSYAWSQGANTASVKVTPTTTTTYTLTGSMTNGCSKTMTISQTVNPCQGLNSIIGGYRAVNVSPNPVRDLLTVGIEQSNVSLTVRITNSLGQLIAETSSADPEFILDFREFSSGIYFISISDGNNQETVKVVKE
jgi:hypothetical protein